MLQSPCCMPATALGAAGERYCMHWSCAHEVVVEAGRVYSTAVYCGSWEHLWVSAYLI